MEPTGRANARPMTGSAKCETGWGDLSTRELFARRDCHPTPPLISFASTLPLQGRVRGVVLLIARIEIVARCRRRGRAFGARAVGPAPTAREALAAAFEAAGAAIDLRLRSGDEGGQAIDAAIIRHRRLRLLLE